MKHFDSNNKAKRQDIALKQGGFTLIEVMIVLVLAAIIMTQAVPSFLTSLKNGRLTTETNKLVADINLGRSEAIKRGKNVIVCGSSNPTALTATCDTTSWTTGWLVFVDEDSSGDYDSSNDTLIHIGNTAEGTVTFTSNATTVTYTSEGLLSNANTVGIAICDDRGVTSGGTTYGRQIQITTTGRPRLITDNSGMTCSPVTLL